MLVLKLHQTVGGCRFTVLHSFLFLACHDYTMITSWLHHDYIIESTCMLYYYYTVESQVTEQLEAAKEPDLGEVVSRTIPAPVQYTCILIVQYIIH